MELFTIVLLFIICKSEIDCAYIERGEAALSTEPALIHENLILTGLQGDNAAEVLAPMANALMKNGNVKEGFGKAVTQREEDQPTGLPAASVGI
jgi:hypothetical protein